MRRPGIDTDKILTNQSESVHDDPEYRRHLIQQRPDLWKKEGRWFDPDRNKPFTLDDEFVNGLDTYPERRSAELQRQLQEKRKHHEQVI